MYINIYYVLYLSPISMIRQFGQFADILDSESFLHWQHLIVARNVRAVAELESLL